MKPGIRSLTPRLQISGLMFFCKTYYHNQSLKCTLVFPPVKTFPQFDNSSKMAVPSSVSFANSSVTLVIKEWIALSESILILTCPNSFREHLTDFLLNCSRAHVELFFHTTVFLLCMCFIFVGPFMVFNIFYMYFSALHSCAAYFAPFTYFVIYH